MDGCTAITCGRAIVAKAGLERFVLACGLFSLFLAAHLLTAHTGSTLLQYTRYRRWTRIAILTESTKRVGPGPTGVLREGGQLHPLDTLAGGETREKTPEKEKEKVEKSPRHRGASLERHTPMVLSAVGSGLKQRLQAAVSGSH